MEKSKLAVVLDELAQLCKKHEMEICACSCSDTCDGISISIRTPKGVIRVDDLGFNTDGQFTNGYPLRVRTRDEVLDKSYEIDYKKR